MIAKLRYALAQIDRLYIVAIIATLLLSFWMAYHVIVINPDGICYLLSAQLFETASLNEVAHFCIQSKWSFYSLLIFLLVQATHVSYGVAAHSLNALFTLTSIMSFLLIVKELGASRRILWFALLVILCDHQFIILREDILRDHGFWAFYLVSIYSLIRYFVQPSWMGALAFNISLLFASLFRIEGAIFFLFMPFVAWFNTSYSWKERCLLFFRLNILTISMTLVLAVAVLLESGRVLTHLDRVSELLRHMQNLILMLTSRYINLKAALLQYILPKDSINDAGPVLIFTWLGWYSINVMQTLSLIYMILFVYAFIKKPFVFASHAALVVYAYLSVNLIMTLCVLAEYLFLSKRYLIALSLVLMLWIPFALEHLYKHRNQPRYQLAWWVCMVTIVGSALGGVIGFGYSKSYIREAGDWLRGQVAKEQRVYANDLQLLYYSNHYGMNIFQKYSEFQDNRSIANGAWKQYDYVALRVDKKAETELSSIMQEMKQAKLTEFHNRRGDSIVIYRVKQEENIS